ncbi:MAG: proline--tRNA ligase [Chloroflexi bacterium]|nr:proline--tRNA ligase [Chloroflexota bacterium]
MRLSNLFGRTLRETPAEADLASHQLLLRAAMVRPLASGIFSYLPLGWRVLRKIEVIMREEMEAIGAQELLMPVLNPAEIWQATGRWQAPAPGPALFRLKDRNQRDLALAMTHEEVLAQLAASEISSYRDLPRLVYHIQTKLRDEPRPRGGLIRVREFTMKDAYSLDADEAGLDAAYEAVYRAYLRIFARCGLRVIVVQADTGMMGGATSHEFMVESPMGEDVLILCPSCGYAANAERAELRPDPPSDAPERPIAEVATPDCKTIEAVAAYVGVPQRQTCKAVFFQREDGSLVFAAIRGDLEVNEVKLANALGGAALAPAGEEALARAGIVAGYASPIGVRGVTVVADRSLLGARNLVAGANRPGYHLLNANYPRDFSADVVADIALARGGDPCPHCGAPLMATRGIEVGHCFKLGTRYSAPVGAAFLDAQGESRPIVMGSYGIGAGRLMASAVEQHHDDKGILWPAALAPYQVHLLHLGAAPEVHAAAEELYARLAKAGYEVLFDDRDESAGVKFNDADLIGLPLRLTVSARNLKQGVVEAKRRAEPDPHLLPLADIEAALRGML